MSDAEYSDAEGPLGAHAAASLNSDSYADSFNELLARRAGRGRPRSTVQRRAVDDDLELLRREKKVSRMDESHASRISRILGGNSGDSSTAPSPGGRRDTRTEEVLHDKERRWKSASTSLAPSAPSAAVGKRPSSKHVAASAPALPPPPPRVSTPRPPAACASSLPSPSRRHPPASGPPGLVTARETAKRAEATGTPIWSSEHSDAGELQPRASLPPGQFDAGDPADVQAGLAGAEQDADASLIKQLFERERLRELHEVAERRRVVELLNSAFRQVWAWASHGSPSQPSLARPAQLPQSPCSTHHLNAPSAARVSQDLEDLISIHLEIATQGLSASAIASVTRISSEQSHARSPQPASVRDSAAARPAAMAGAGHQPPSAVQIQVSGMSLNVSRLEASGVSAAGASATGISAAIGRLCGRLDELEGTLMGEVRDLRSVVALQASESRKVVQLLHASFSLSLSLQEQQARTATVLSSLASHVTQMDRQSPTSSSACSGASSEAASAAQGGDAKAADPDGERAICASALLHAMQREQQQLAHRFLQMRRAAWPPPPASRGVGRRISTVSTRAIATRTRGRGGSGDRHGQRAAAVRSRSGERREQRGHTFAGAESDGGGSAGCASPPRAAVASRDACVICYERPAAAVFYRCGHLCACNQCAFYMHSQQQSCPLCRSKIDEVIRVFTC